MPGKSIVLGLSAVLAVAGGFSLRSLEDRVTRAFEGSVGGGLRLYSAPFRVRPGIDLEGAGFRDRLLRLGYRETSGASADPATGTFRDDPTSGAIEIDLRGFDDGEIAQAAGPVRIEIERGFVSRIVAFPSGTEIAEAWLEPEALGRFGDGGVEPIRPVRLEALPPWVVHAVLAAEDVRFSSHAGIDPIGIVRAAWVNFRAGGIEQGGSTITQQLVKNMMLEAKRTWSRKIEEALLAIVIDFRFSKEQILQAYLDTVYMGRIGAIGVRGLAQASRGFFGKEPEQLTPAEAATLAGLIRSPNRNSPVRHPSLSRERRNQVLALMAEHGWLDAEQLATSTAAPLEVHPREPVEAPFFVEEVIRRLKSLGLDEHRDASVYTTLDVELQHAAESAVSAELAKLEERVPAIARAPEPVEAAAVVLEARSGAVQALVGGRDRSRSQFDHATRARRQPGSAFKPFVFLAAADSPLHPLTPSTLIADAPVQVRTEGRVWRPRNSDGRFVGRLTARRALEQSRNIPAYHVAKSVGLERVREVAASAGLEGLPDVPSLALGTGEVTLLDLTAAYDVFPNLGEFAPPTLIRTVRDDAGETLYRASLVRHRVASPPAAFVVSHVLEGVVDRGTARDVRRLGLDAPLAGKTGTTDEERDAWFVGYSPDVVVGVWVGFDEGRTLGVSAAKAAVPAWVPIMRRVLDASGRGARKEFEVPDGVVFRDVELRSGLLATKACPQSIREAFVAGTEPSRTCEDAPVRTQRASRKDEGGSFWKDVGDFFGGLFD